MKRAKHHHATSIHVLVLDLDNMGNAKCKHIFLQQSNNISPPVCNALCAMRLEELMVFSADLATLIFKGEAINDLLVAFV